LTRYDQYDHTRRQPVDAAAGANARGPTGAGPSSPVGLRLRRPCGWLAVPGGTDLQVVDGFAEA